MHRIFVFASALLFALALPLAAAGPDDEFIEIYGLIQQADSLNTSGQSTPARQKYEQAETALKKFQKAHPSWNVKLIQFRLNYVAKKLEALPADQAVVTTPSAPTLTQAPKAAEPSPQLLALEQQVKTSQERIRQLEADKGLLEAKLKEALVAQPAAVDPRELEKAEARARQLQKENDLLKVSLDQERAKLARVVDAALFEEAKQQLAEAAKQLTQQTDAVAALKQEREVLQRRLKSLNEKADAAVKNLSADNERLRAQVGQLQPKAEAAAQLDALKQGLEQSQKALAEEQAMTERLRGEKQALETRLKDLLAMQKINADGQTLTLDRAPVDEQFKQEVMTRLTAVRDDLQKAREALGSEQARVDKLQTEKLDLERRLSESETREQARATELENLKQGLIQAENKLATEQTRADKLTAEKTELEGSLKELRVASAAKLSAKPATATEAEAPPARPAPDDEARRAEMLLAEKTAAEKRFQELLTTRDAEARTKTAALEKELVAAKATAEENAAFVAKLQAALAGLEKEKQAWERERAKLDIKVASATPLVPSGGSQDAEKLKQLEQQRDELQKKIDALTKELTHAKARADAAKSEELSKQLEALRAKVQAYEAERVPYTPEELALFKKPDTAVARIDAASRGGNKKSLPPGAEPLVAEAQKAFAAGRLDEAAEKYQAILKLDAENVFALANLAVVQLEQQKHTEAEANLKRALALDPKDVHALSQLGYLKYLQEKSDEAIDALGKATQLEPEKAEIQNYLGLALSQKGLRFQAETALRKAVKLAPGYASAHHNLAVVYATQQPPFVALARWHYLRALDAGQRRNPDLEKLIESQQSDNGKK